MIISELDQLHLVRIRQNVSKFIMECAERFDNDNVQLLDIAPQVHKGAAEHFKKAIIRTLDIDSNSAADYIADICKNNSDIIGENLFDVIICTEVLEHTLNPFNAINEIYRILKPNGFVCISTPFNFRIHGPLPDCWRFTEYGLRSLLSSFEIISINELPSENRELMPIHYTVIAEKLQTFIK